MKYAGFYINLDRSPDRRASIESELARAGLTGYARFPASDGNTLNFPNRALKNGEMGCFTSHYRLLTENRQTAKPLHVIEDDIVFSPQTGKVLDWVIESGKLSGYDLVFTDVTVPLLNDACQEYKKFYDATVKRAPGGAVDAVTFSVVDMRELIFASTYSFLVNPQSIEKIIGLYESAFAAGPALPIDLYLRKLCQDGVLRIGCVFPFVTSTRLETDLATTIENRFDRLAAIAANLLHHSFFVGCDWNQSLAAAEKLFPEPASDDPHRQLMLRLLGYSLLPGYKKP